METNTNKKRSFSTFESNQNNVDHSPHKKQKMTGNKKNKRQRNNKHDNFFHVRFNQSDDLDLTTSHCLIFRKLLPIMQENHLYGLIKNKLHEWYDSKKQNKNANQVAMDGKIDIHLYHNRHNSGITGFAYVYFENKSDASYILQLSQQKNLKNLNRTICCEWKTNDLDRDHYSSIYQTSDDKKGMTQIIKISNLHWKTTLLHLYKLFTSFKDKDDDKKDAATKTEEADGGEEDVDMDFEPRWMKIHEDKNGYPKCMALVMLSSPQNVVYCIDKLQNYKLLGRRLKMEYSCYEHEGSLMTKYNEANLQLAGLTKKILISNLKQSVKTSDIKQFLKANIENKNLDEIVRDIYLFHNLEKVCAGKCFIEFDNEENAKECLQMLQLKQLCHRTVVVEYGHLHNEYQDKVDENKHLRGKTNRLFMSNLAWDVKEKDIQRFFGDKIKINNVYFNIHASGFPKGSAFITFEDFDVAAKVMDKSNGKKLKNRVVHLDFSAMLKSNHWNNEENNSNDNYEQNDKNYNSNPYMNNDDY